MDSGDYINIESDATLTQRMMLYLNKMVLF